MNVNDMILLSIDDHIIEEGTKPLLVYREQKASA